MKVLVINGSPSGENSITLQTVKYIEKYFTKCSFDYLNVGQRIRSFEKDFSEAEKSLEEADLLLFAYPVYTFLAPSQLHRFIELIKERGIDLKGKYATQITTSKHFYDTTAHQFLNENLKDMGLKIIRGLSADMEDLLHKEGRREALQFFSFVRWNMNPKSFRPEYFLRNDERKRRVVIVTDLPCVESMADKESGADGEPEGTAEDGTVFREGEKKTCLEKMIEDFRAVLPCETQVVNLREFPFKGGCLGCFHCASTGECIYKDGFDSYLRENIQTADAIVYAFKIKDHSMGSRFKMYDDRQFCNGHRTVTMGKPVAYLVEGDYESEENLKILLEARSQVGGNFLAGVAVNGEDEEYEIRRTAATLCYAMEKKYQEPKNFYGVGGLKIFRDLIYQMQGLMREDHRFYKEHGFYDFPQKKKGKILAMYLVGAMMNNKAVNRKIGGHMTEGMLLPYKKILEQK